MKRRLLQLLSTATLLLVLLASGLFGFLTTALDLPTASADTTGNYIFYTPTGNDSLTAIKKALDEHDESAGALSDTAVYVNGGPFDKPFALQLDTDRTGCAQANSTGFGGCNGKDNFGGPGDDVYVYSATYICDPSKGMIDSASDGEYYTVDYNVSMKLGKTGEDHALFDSNGKLHSSAKLHWVGFGSTSSVGVKYTPASSTTSAREEQDKKIKDLPDKCVPPNVPSGVSNSDHDDTQLNNKGIINLDVKTFATADQSTKDAWGDLDTTASEDGIGGGSTSGSLPGLQCKVKWYNPLTWLLCPAVKGMVNIIGELDSVINSELSVGSPGASSDPNQIFCDSSTKSADKKTCSSYETAWRSVRDISLGLMVIAGLIILISQALGLEVLDAYAIRKALPRVLVAAVVITLSWQLMRFFVELTNALGFGVRYLIYAPFHTLDSPTLDGGGQAAVTLATGAAIWALGIFGALSFALTAALGVFVAFIVLIVRELLITVLIIFAPIAIVAYILPNTQNFFKLWWDSFSKALIMFPIISAMIASGRVFAAVAGTNNNSELGQLMGFAAYFAPYFLLPLAFRFAGGALRGIGGFVNDRGRGGFDRLKRYRGNKVNENMAKTRDFSRFSERTAAGRRANDLLGVAGNPSSLLRGRSGISATRKARQLTQGANAMKENAIWQANQGDDNFLLAVANRDLATSKRNRALGRSQDMSLSADQRMKAQQEADVYGHALDAASQLGATGQSRAVRLNALNGLAKTGFQFDQGQEGYTQLNDTVRQIVGNDGGSYASAMNEAQYNLRTAGRYDLGGINHGAGYDPNAGTSKASLYELANGKVEGIQGMADVVGHGPVGQAHSVLYKELEAMKSNAKGANRDAIVRQMTNLEGMGVKNYLIRDSAETDIYRENYDAARVAAPGYTGPAWTAAEATQGWRQRTRTLTNDEAAQKRARSYERPDPNRLST